MYQVKEGGDPRKVAPGRAIRQLRKEAKLTQRQLAQRAGVSVRELRRIEAGGADWGAIRHLACGMDVSLTDVFRLAEQLEAD